ncbi:MFS transporter [Bacillus sp. SJS]|uniref:MFS transporter n=1 Tax=Bacillus sp. SJS TaxID=1423321 RepID=UPI00055675D0|nr:MFS transporter [Bacillus sp. SJS]KZZ85727.1 MFS transporter [Bacillus sp. SJS]
MEASLAKKRSVKLNFYLFYFLVFFGIGSLSPLLSVYLRDEIGLSGSQIGMVLSISPVVMILIQPVWGILSDVTKKPVHLLTAAIAVTALMGIAYSAVSSYSLIIGAAALLAIFQAAIIPLSDSISINYVQKTKMDYGSIRLWGAIGFAVSVLAVGKLAETTSLSVIFYTFTLVMGLGMVFAWQLPRESKPIKVSFKKGMSDLVKAPSYFIFLAVAFLVLGPILANNFYFGIFVDDLGGGLAGIGLAFMLAAGSEAPVMKYANRWIGKFGMKQILLLAAIVSMARWFLYFFEPPLALVYATTVAQGFSTGLFIPAALQYVKDIAPVSAGATAISLYSAVGNGLGNWFCTFLGGFILEAYSVFSVYLFFGILSLLAVILLLFVKQEPGAPA